MPKKQKAITVVFITVMAFSIKVKSNLSLNFEKNYQH